MITNDNKSAKLNDIFKVLKSKNDAALELSFDVLRLDWLVRGFEKDTSRFLNTVKFLIVFQVRKCIKIELQDNLNPLLYVRTCLSQIISNSNVNVKYSTFISPRETPRHKVQPAE